MKKGVLKKFTKFTGKYLSGRHFFKKNAGLRPAPLLKKRLCYSCFHVNFVKILKCTFFTEHLWEIASDFSRNIKIIHMLFCWYRCKINLIKTTSDLIDEFSEEAVNTCFEILLILSSLTIYQKTFLNASSFRGLHL